MKIVKANKTQINIINKIVQDTIDSIYPKYYPKGAVNFFKSYHNDVNILKDINEGNVFLLQVDDTYVGTVTKQKNEINRLFILQQYQHNGYGKILLDFIENKIAEEYFDVQLSTSLPAKKMYLNRGYIETEYLQIVTENKDVLCYDNLYKVLKKDIKDNTTNENKL